MQANNITRYVTIILGLLVVSTAHGEQLPNYNAYFDVAPAARATGPAASAPWQGRIAAIDDWRGVPTVLWAHRGQIPKSPEIAPEAAARWYLDRHASLYRLSRAALDNIYVHRVHDVGRGGIIVLFRQRVGGIDVYQNELKVLLTRDLRLVAITGSLHDQATDQAVKAGAGVRINSANALAAALSDLYGVEVEAGSVRDLNWQVAGYGHFDLVPGSRARRDGIQLSMPARVKPVYFPLPNALVPGYFVEFFSTRVGQDSDDVYAFIMSAVDGRLLYRENLKVNEAFEYRVWADATAPFTPLDGPQDDFTPHPTGVPGLPEPAFIAPGVISIEGFNTNPDGLVDPWLPSGAIETQGNNVDAYADHFEPDGFSEGDLRAAITAPGVFDYIYDTGIGPLDNQTQTEAAITQLFYVNNWLHDYFYDSGFNEAAGNAQNDNFGRGGIGGDALRAEAQDQGPNRAVRNNANMSTPADGVAPRMQMFLWTTPDLVRRFDALEQSFATATAAFGPLDFAVTGNLVVADDESQGDDGTGAVTDACEPIVNDVSGAIALIDRGSCSFVQKTQNAAAAGAIAVIIANNIPGNVLQTLGAAAPVPDIAIPALSITFEAGVLIKDALDGGPVAGEMERATDFERDGTIDNAIVAHEWGHYIHHRLVACGTPQCGGQSEGWGDFMALHMMVREGDDFTGAYAMSIYATLVLGDNTYFGIRRVPYSVDPSKNALRLRHIVLGEALPDSHPLGPGSANNAQVHNVGEIWASMLFDGYVAMLQQTQADPPPYDFTEAKRRMTDYIVAGMILAPPNPTFTEQRDAILAAAAARDESDMLLLAQGFATRGAGSCAVSPPRNSVDMIGTVEDTQLRANMAVEFIGVTESAASCDNDGFLDDQETGLIEVTIDNPSPVVLQGTTLTIASSVPGVTFPNGAVFDIADLAPFAATTVSVSVRLDHSALATFAPLDLEMTLNNPETCATTVTEIALPIGDFDLAPAGDESAESPEIVWTQNVLVGAEEAVWTRAREADGTVNHFFAGADSGSLSDVAFESPLLQVSTSEAFVVSFEHRYQFEAGQGGGGEPFFDGAVVEVSTDGGSTYQDVSDFIADPGYSGVIFADSGNPLGNRPGYVAFSPQFPVREQVTFDFADQLAGLNVKLRFRIGTDVAAGGLGWEVDNITFQGLDNVPFLQVVDDVCEINVAPAADAGEDRSVRRGTTVTLDGSGSFDANGDDLTFFWGQSAGISVVLSDNGTATPSFVAPSDVTEAVLSFQVVVNDGAFISIDTVNITVLANEAPTASAGADQTVRRGTLVSLDASGSADPESDVLTFSWNQVGGPEVSLTGSDTATPTFTAPTVEEDEDLSFEVFVNDGLGAVTDTVQITVVANDAPAVDAGADQTVRRGASVTLDASGTTDPEADELSFAWNQIEGTEVTLSGSDTAVSTFTAPAGTEDQVLRFEVGVDDGLGAVSDTVQVTVVANDAPTADAGEDQTVVGGSRVTLDATGSTDPENDTLSFTWIQTDGPQVTLGDGDTDTAQFTAPTMAEPVTLTFEVRVDDGFGDVADAVTITVEPSPSDGPDGGPEVPDGGPDMPDGGPDMPDGGPDMPDSGPGNPGDGDGGGCGCSVGGKNPNSGSVPALFLFAGIALFTFRRRIFG